MVLHDSGQEEHRDLRYLWSGSLTGEQQANTRGGLEQLAAVGRTGRTTLTAAMDDQPAREGNRGHGVFTFALLAALARGNRNRNGLVEVTEFLEHVMASYRRSRTRPGSAPDNPLAVPFALTKQLPSLAPAPGEEMIISPAPTHVVSEPVEVLKSAGATGSVVQKLDPVTTWTLIRTDQGWALVAKDGKALGYVAAGRHRHVSSAIAARCAPARARDRYTR